MIDYQSRGGHVADAVWWLTERVRSCFVDAAADEFTALRAPVDADPSVRVPTIICGFPDPQDRSTPRLPFVAVRATSVGPDTQATQAVRVAGCQIMIAVHCADAGDYEYAWVISERIWRTLAERPYLLNGQYPIRTDDVICSEDGELMSSWQAYVLVMTVGVVVPWFGQTQLADGGPIVQENMYGE